MKDVIIAEAENWLKREAGLPRLQRVAMAALVPDLLTAIPSRRPTLIGLGGPPGTGKSTLAGLLRFTLARQGKSAAVLSLDDYYLTHEERRAMARSMHPLWATRGVPGTHDLERLAHDLDGLASAAARPLELLRFDKSTDDRASPAWWHSAPPDVILLEGWCIGCPPGAQLMHAPTVNDVERERDPDGHWWRRVCSQLVRQERLVHTRLDQRWLLLPPDWNHVSQWRWQQEQALGARRRLHDPAQVRAFLATFERLARHIMATGAEWADVVITLDRAHLPRLAAPD